MKEGRSTTVVATSFVLHNTFNDGGRYFRVRTADDYYDFALYGRVPPREELRERLASIQRTAADWTSHAAMLEAALEHHKWTAPAACEQTSAA